MKGRRRWGLLALVIGLVGLAGCRPGAGVGPEDEQPPEASPLSPVVTNEGTAGAWELGQDGCHLQSIGYPANAADGNHFVRGWAHLPEAKTVDIELAAEPLWVVGVSHEEGSLWAVGTAEGAVERLSLTGDRIERELLTPQRPADAPLALRQVGGSAELLGSRLPESSDLSHPVAVGESELAAVSLQGDLLLTTDDRVDHWPVNALPDARVLSVDEGRLLLVGPTDRYGHGVLGDGLEGGSLALLSWRGRRILWKVDAPAGSVFEGIAPLWGELDGRGDPEIVATVSNSEVGARYVVHSSEGRVIASSEGIGQGGRWRHAIAIAPFGPGGEPELAGVHTPHLGRTVEFFRLETDQLVPTATLPGYSSHQIGSRNLDMALAGDFDGDGRMELLVPDGRMERLAAVRRTSDGAEEVWSLPLPARLTSNLAAACHRGTELALAAGGEGRTLRLWLPE